jgi:hypothetical protein
MPATLSDVDGCGSSTLIHTEAIKWLPAAHAEGCGCCPPPRAQLNSPRCDVPWPPNPHEINWHSKSQNYPSLPLHRAPLVAARRGG